MSLELQDQNQETRSEQNVEQGAKAPDIDALSKEAISQLIDQLGNFRSLSADLQEIISRRHQEIEAEAAELKAAQEAELTAESPEEGAEAAEPNFFMKARNWLDNALERGQVVAAVVEEKAIQVAGFLEKHPEIVSLIQKFADRQIEKKLNEEAV